MQRSYHLCLKLSEKNSERRDAPHMSVNACVKNKERTIPTTFDKFSNYYFEKFYKRKVCDTTYRVAMSNYKNHVLPHFGDMPLKQITADKCQELLDRLIAEDKVRTEENVFTMLNMIFKAAVKHSVMTHNPIDMVFHTKHEREHGKALSKDEERRNRLVHGLAPQRIQDGGRGGKFHSSKQQQEKKTERWN